MKTIHSDTRERRSAAQSFQRTPTVMALLYLKIPLRYNSDPPYLKKHWCYMQLKLNIYLFFFLYRVPEKWSGKRTTLTIRGMKSTILLLGFTLNWLNWLTEFINRHLNGCFLNQQLSANECWTARGRWNHMGKWRTADWKHKLQIKRWLERPRFELTGQTYALCFAVHICLYWQFWGDITFVIWNYVGNSALSA